MESPRRTGSPDAKTRRLLIEAAERLLLRDGYSAVTGRAVAKEAGQKSQLVPYHFGTMEDLFVAVFRRRAEQGLKMYRAALKSEKPLWTLWRMGTDTRGVAFAMEFVALANRRKVLKKEIAFYLERMRGEQTKVFSKVLKQYGISSDNTPAEVFMMLLTSVSGVLAIEDSLGMTAGHTKTLAWVESWIRELEGDPPDGLVASPNASM